MLWPAFVIAASAPPPGAVPVVTKISGAVSVRGQGGVSNEVISSRIVHSGDVLMTGVDSLALVNLADVGGVRIGPTSTVKATATNTSLSVEISSGSACAQALSRGVSISAGPLAITAGDETAIFSLLRKGSDTTLAVYQGSVVARVSGSAKTLTFKAGEAATTSGGAPEQVPLQNVQPSFASLQCPDPDVIANVMPTPIPSPPSGGSHGGGAGAILAALLGIGAIAAAAGHGGGGGGGGAPPPTNPPTPPPSALEVNTTSLTFSVGGPPQPFTASEANYHGPINAVSNDTTVATVSPGSGNGPGPVTFMVTPKGGIGASGNQTTITVTDNHGGQQIVNVTIGQAGSVMVNPSSLTFLVGGTSQTFKASQSNYSGPLTAISNNTSVATVSGSGNGPGPVTFTVTAQNAGSTTITVSGVGAPSTVTVAVIGPLQANPASLTFSGTQQSQSFLATDPSYSGTLTATSGDPTVATVSPHTANGPSTSFTVTPVNMGSTTVTVTDTFGGSTGVSIVVSAGGLVVNPGNLTLAVGVANKTFTASESDYTGPIKANPSDGSATVSPAQQNGPGPVTFTVSPVSAGNPTVAVTDNNSNVKFVNLTITGPLTVGPPSSLTFNGTTAPQNLSVSDPNYFGSIGASSANQNVATVNSPVGGPNATFNVTPVASGTTTINFTDANGASATANIAVNPGPLQVSTNSVTLNGSSASSQFTASEALYTGAISASSGDKSVVTVSPASGSGPGPVTFTLDAVGPGSTTVTVTDDHGGNQQITVTVAESPTLSPPSVTLTDTGPGTGTSISISEPGYSGPFNVTGNTCNGPGGIANIGPAGSGPSSSVSVEGRKQTASGGTCQFTIQDSFGNTSQPASVTVGPFGPVAPNPTSLTFSDITTTQSFTVSESNYTGPFSVDASACNNIASVSPSTGSAGTQFVVTPLGGGGPCNISVSDDHTQQANVSVTVGPFGAISPNPTSFAFTDVGPGAAQTLTVSESGYTGQFTIDASACSGIATVNPASSTGSFTVTPTGSGGPCNLNVTDDHNTPAVQVSVTVGPFGPTVPSTGSLNLGTGGNNGSFTVSETGYTGNFTLTDSSCASSGAASVSPMTGNASTTFTVSPLGAGNCKIVIADDAGDPPGNVDVFVTSGSIVLTPDTLTFPSGSAGAQQTFTVSDPACGPGDLVTATPDGTVAASVSPVAPQLCGLGGGSITYTVTAGSDGQGSVVVADSAGGKGTVSVGVGQSPLKKKHKGLGSHTPAPSGSSTPRPIGGHNPVPTGPHPHPSPSPHPVASPSPRPAPSPVGALRVSSTNLTFVQNGGPQGITISEPGYTRAFQVTTADGSIASTNVQNALGPNVTLLIAPKGVGVTTIQIADDHGGVQIIHITVRPLVAPKGGKPIN